MKIFIKQSLFKNLSTILLILFVLVTSGSAYAVQVDNTYTPLAPLPCISTPGSTDSNGNTIPAVTCGDPNNVDFQSYVGYVLNLTIAIAAVLAVFMITWGGFMYMTSDAIQEKKEGLEKIKNAVYGLLLVLASFLILRTINPQFVQVPNGLVPAANLKPPERQIGSWADELKQQINAYNAQSAENRRVIAEILNKNVQLSDEGKSLEKQIADITGNPNNTLEDCAYYLSGNDFPGNLEELCRQWLDNQDQQQQNNSAGQIQISVNLIDSFSGDINSQSSFATKELVNKEIATLESTYKTEVKKLNDLGIIGNQLNPLNNAYHKADIQIRQAYVSGDEFSSRFFNNHDDNAASEQLKSIVKTDIPNITDSKIKSEMIKSISTQIDNLNVRYKKENSGMDNTVLINYRNLLKSMSQ